MQEIEYAHFVHNLRTSDISRAGQILHTCLGFFFILLFFFLTFLYST